MSTSIQQTWDLQSILREEDFDKCVQKASSDLNQYSLLIKNADQLKEAILLFQEIGIVLKDLDAFVSCRLAENTKNPQAINQSATVTSLNASLEKAHLALARQLSHLNDREFEGLLKNTDLAPIAFYLTELRNESKSRLEESLESKITTLSVDGYHSFWSLYRSFMGKLQISLGERKLSIGQAENLLTNPDRSLRQEVFITLQQLWANHADIFSQLLNHLAGFRLNVYAFRGWNETLFEPLQSNRLQAKTLEVMWAVIEQNKAPFLRYFQKKAEYLGVDKLSWYDLQTPLIGRKGRKLGYEEALEFIIQQFQDTHPKMADFVRKVENLRWIESADRVDKQSGAFCVAFPGSDQSRIFMTYDENSMFSLATLAHELGHAYHYDILYQLPYLSQSCRMAVAETASTFAEMLVVDRAIKKSQDREEKLFLLDDKLQRSTLYLMNIHARFLFEQNFYQERKLGHVGPERLCYLMEEAQKKAYLNGLKEYHPYFWVSKLHFYFTEFPFYNFPYTFGFLFSLGIYAQVQEEGKNFAKKYDALLLDSGRMTMEDLAKKHLGQDITQPQFWEKTLNILHQDVNEFLRLMNLTQ